MRCFRFLIVALSLVLLCMSMSLIRCKDASIVSDSIYKDDCGDVIEDDWSFHPIRWPDETNVMTVVSPVREIGFPRDLFATWKNDHGSFLFRVRCSEDGVRPCIALLQQDKSARGIEQLFVDERPGAGVVRIDVGADPESPSGLRCAYWWWQTTITDETLRYFSQNKEDSASADGSRRIGGALNGMNNCDFGDDSFLFASVRGMPDTPFVFTQKSGDLDFEVSTWENPIRLLAIEPGSPTPSEKDNTFSFLAGKELMIVEELESFPMPPSTLRNVSVFEILDLLRHGFSSPRIRLDEPRCVLVRDSVELVLPVREGAQSELELAGLLSCSGCDGLLEAERRSPRVSLYTWKTNALAFLRMVADSSGGTLHIQDGAIRLVYTRESDKNNNAVNTP